MFIITIVFDLENFREKYKTFARKSKTITIDEDYDVKKDLEKQKRKMAREQKKQEELSKQQAEQKKLAEEQEKRRLADLVDIKKRICVFNVNLDEKRSRIIWNQKGFKNSGEIFERIQWKW